MGFTLRFMLGVALVLATCSVLNCASTWRRHIRETSSFSSTSLEDGPSETAIFHGDDTATKGENVDSDNGLNKTADNFNKEESSKRKIEKNDEVNAEKKPKTDENSTEINVNITTTTTINEKTKIEDSLEKPVENLTKESQNSVSDKVPESKHLISSSRAEEARSLNIDIHKYVSPDFHNKNNVYSFSVSPDTEKYINLHNDLPKSTTTTKLQQNGQNLSGFFGSIEDTTTNTTTTSSPSLNDDFDVKFQHIEDAVKQKLESIDHHFAEEEAEFKKSRENVNLTKILDEHAKNDTTIDLKYIKFKNITSNFTKNKNNVHKDVELESGESIDFVSSYNKTQIYDEQPQKDYKNKISVNEGGGSLSELISDVKPQTPSKISTANQTESNSKSLLSNKIETELANSGENLKPKWSFAPLVTVKPATTTTVTTTKKPIGQKEQPLYVPYTKENLINISKRGSTKFIDTLTTTTEIPVTSLRTRTASLKNKQALANKENKTLEQAVLENQVYPVQISSSNSKEDSGSSKEEKFVVTTTSEGPATSTRLYTAAAGPNASLLPSTATPETQTETTTQKTIEDQQKNEATTKEPTETSVIPLIETTTTQNVVVTGSTSIEPITSTPPTEYVFSTDSSTETVFSTTLQEEITTPPIEVTTDGAETTTTSLGFETTSEKLFSSTSTESNTTLISTTEETSSTIQSESTQYEDRSSSGRELKGNGTTMDYSNNLDANSSLGTTDANFSNAFTTTETTFTTTSTTTNSVSPSKTTSDYRDNIILKQNDPSSPTITTILPNTSTSTKKLEEFNHENGSKSNSTETEGEDEANEDETEDEMDHEGGDHEHTTIKTRMIKPSSTEATPFIVPLNVSMVIDADTSTDSTSVDELGSDAQDDGGGGGPIAAIVISCIGAVCLVVLAGLLFVMRKRHKRFNYGQRCTPVSLDAYSVDNVSVYNSMRRKGIMRASKRSYGNPAFDDPSSVTHSLNFPALAKFAGNSEGIATEFEEIPQVTAQMNELPEGCETKNRYANVIPLPESRVFLRAIEGYPNSDYINANYVTGPKSTRGYYIACQAPMQGTVDDFWRMVWEQQSKVILMLTHLFENGTEKCVDYLPPSEVLDCHRLFGDFQVTLKKREVKEKYVISSLQLKNMVSNSWREVTHLWYIGWPEKGVPSEANSLIAFLIEARSYLKAITSENGRSANDHTNNGTGNNEQSPVIVHCSPGTGRTGTVIACDIAIREFELTRQVDIPKTVYRIRRDRASAVQTKEQYAFVYKVISLYATKLTGGVLDSL